MTATPGEIGQLEHLVGGEHDGAVDVEARNGAGHGPGGEDDVVAGQLGGVAVSTGDGHGAIRTEGAGAVQHGDLAALHQAGQAFVELVDHLLLAGDGDREIELGGAGGDAEAVGAGDRAEHRGGLEQLLGGDATPVEAGAAHLVHLDHRDVEPGASAVEGGGVPAGAATDDDDIEVLGRDDHLLGGSRRSLPAVDQGVTGPGPFSEPGPQRTESTCTVKAIRIARPHKSAVMISFLVDMTR